MREVIFFQWTPPPSLYHSNPCICKDSDLQSSDVGIYMGRTTNHGIIEVLSGAAVAVCEVRHGAPARGAIGVIYRLQAATFIAFPKDSTWSDKD